jgi:arsenate reductase-like glutaredoxin family protein
VAELADANKNPHDLAKALTLAKGVKRIIATKGKKVFEMDLAAEPSASAIADLIIGPTGKLRAPAFRKGATLVVGFAPEVYQKLLR